jgi:hypothetical protein
MKEIRSSLNLGLGLDLRQSLAAILLKSLRQLSPWPPPLLVGPLSPLFRGC